MQVTLDFMNPLSSGWGEEAILPPRLELLCIPIGSSDGGRLMGVQGAHEGVRELLARAWERGDFRGRSGDSLTWYSDAQGGGGASRVLLIGAGRGELAELDREEARRLGARVVRGAEALHLSSLVLLLPNAAEEGAPVPPEVVAALGEGAVLAAWDYRELRARREPTPEGDRGEPPLVEGLTIALPGREGEAPLLESALRAASAAAAGANLARGLQTRPGNVATPTHLATTALELAERFGFIATILGPRELEAEGMRTLLAVSAGSEEEARLIVLEHWGGEPGTPPIALVGKGLTFDSGGISIKPADRMEEMKYDMSGGAAVLGAMQAIGELGLPVNVVAVVPSSENLLSGRAVKPGDVIRTHAGKTVEVINTDAEGRLILADALSYVVAHYAPGAIVDCATLTGACVIALGHEAIALLSNDEALATEVRTAGDLTGERCWPLPLWKEYRKQLESEVADLKNVGGRPAGTITAAHFLREFVGDTPWVHLDIAGTAYGDPRAPYHRKGAFGLPARLLVEWVRGRSA